MPSGIKPGTAKKSFFDEVKRIPLPEYLMPVIEDGNYDQTKACVFQVLSLWCFDVMMEDLMEDFAHAGFQSRRHTMNRRWAYIQNCPDADQLIATEVDVTFWIDPNGCRSEIHLVVERLARKYGFRCDKVTYDGRIQRLNLDRNDPMAGNMYYQNAPEELSMRLLFPFWG